MKKVVNKLLNVEELCDLEESLRAELQDNLLTILTKLNRTDQLEKLLSLLGLEKLLYGNNNYQVFKTGKILVIGQSKVKNNSLLAVAEQCGIDKSRIELYLEYEDGSKYDFRKIQWDSKYSAILVGPLPHSGVSKGDYSSVITAIEKEDGYPPVIRLGTTSLHITKSDFRKKLKELLDEGIILA